MVKDDPYAVLLGFPKCPSFFYGTLSPVYISDFDKSHGVCSGSNELNHVVYDLATFSVSIGGEALIRAKLWYIGVGSYKIGKSSFSIGSESCFANGICWLERYRAEVKAVRSVNYCLG